jgi:hypothetical protein
MRGQHRACVHPVVAGANVLPALAGKNVYESLVPGGLIMAHVTHITGKTICIALCLPGVGLMNIIECFIDVVKRFVLIIPEWVELISVNTVCHILIVGLGD